MAEQRHPTAAEKAEEKTERAAERAAEKADKAELAASAEAEAEEARRPRDNRRILKGVQIMTPEGLKTFSGDDEKTLDELERTLTPEQMLRLKGRGALEGNWECTGKPAEPMPGSKLARAGAEVERLKKALAADKPAKKG